MSVLSGGTKLVFCEGPPDPNEQASFDKVLLNRMLHGKPPNTVIVPAGGKHQLRAFIQGRLARENAGGISANYLAFRDRDFDAEPNAEVSLIQFRSGESIYMSHRAAVENYLLDVSLIHRYWKENLKIGPSWKHGDSPGEEVIRSWMDEAARALTNYQSIRWALARLKPSDRWPEVRTTWTIGSGSLPSSLDERECLEQAKKLVSDFSTATARVSEANLLERYAEYLVRFSAEQFVIQSDYLVWFHGKDLKKAMQRLRPNSISLDHFCGWAVSNLDWKQHIDLQELETKI